MIVRTHAIALLGLIAWIAFCLGAPMVFQDERIRAAYTDAERLQAICHNSHADPTAPGLTPELREIAQTQHDNCDRRMSVVHYLTGHFMEYEVAVVKLAVISGIFALIVYSAFMMANYRRPRKWHHRENRPHLQHTKLNAPSHPPRRRPNWKRDPPPRP